MLEKLLKWDRDTFVYLNGLGIEDYDLFWATVTNFSTWIPLFILFLILFSSNFPKRKHFTCSLLFWAWLFLLP